ncbi:capsule assembly Wzi family protein [Thermaurantiacus sp.]
MRVALATMLLTLTAPAAAGPWAEPGDARLRADIELMRSNGLISGPMGSWPLPWAQIDRGLARADGLALPPGVAAAVRRVKALSDYNRKKNRFRAEMTVANAPALVRGFQESARGQVDMEVGAEHDLDWITLGWGASYIKPGDTPATAQGGGVQLRPLYAAVPIGNWAFYGGHVETYWGPSEEGGLLFSTSARPFPKIGFKVLEPRPLRAPVLRWLGPVGFDIFGGVLNEERDFANTAVIGMRLAFAPAPGLSVGLNRAMQLCGRGRPCDARIFALAFVGFGDADNTGTPDEPGNQLAGFDLAYSFRIGRAGHGGKLFFETVAEDADNIVIEQFARRGGGRLHGPLGTAGAVYSAGIEYVDSLASNFFGGNKFPGSLYNNFIYVSGFTYDRRPIGFSLDGDTRLLTFDAAVTDARNRRVYGSIRQVNINVSESPSYRISKNNERFLLATVGAEMPTRFGDVRLELRAQGDQPDTPGTRDGAVQFEAGWKTRF